MKLILIEDEPESLMGMKHAIKSIDLEFILYTANHAEKALSMIIEERPDLIVTDIMLPYMTGLELVEQVTSEEYKPLIIVVSGYNDFEYARKSIQVGAVDYLLKPFRTEEFTDKIRKALLSIQEKNLYLLETNKQKAYAEIGNRSMRDDYLTDFCLKRTPLEEHVYQRLRVWEIEWLVNQSFSLIILDTKGYPEGKSLGHEYSLQTFAIGNIAQELLGSFSPSILFKDTQNRWVLLTGVEDVEGLSAHIFAEVRHYQKLSLAIGISSRKSNFEHIHTAYNEALKAFRLNSLSDSEAYVYQGEQAIYPDDEDSLSPSVMSSLMIERDEVLIRRGVHRFIRHVMMTEGTLSREDMVRGILNYLSQVHIRLSETTSKELQEIPMKVWEMFDECKTLEDCELTLNNYLIAVSRELSPQKSNALVERAMQLISTRFKEDLTLQIVADELSLHPVWLSQLIKKETGQTYLDHLTERRIEQARGLLRETNLKIYEIAEQVGYHDLQHFGQIFKRRSGQTPKEYRYGK
ncbi:response regulator [Paenibacillus alginolyticus]|uniref:Response regulator n=1 Tax=Paenibacillus alginolyticus TaxID=59839 RepID=A0ABT4GNX2_9BACL|nr:response regulator [Paenibacillus alginolyticus]MCY9666751.1 response regulator [Paenibacillus alginolyticus]MCY9697704.1 response regulator [Paenibacillus alginolyticus]MEC0146736.1 response regulator [Paenibacillus alginolyticus]